MVVGFNYNWGKYAQSGAFTVRSGDSSGDTGAYQSPQAYRLVAHQAHL